MNVCVRTGSTLIEVDSWHNQWALMIEQAAIQYAVDVITDDASGCSPAALQCTLQQNCFEGA